MDWQTIERRGSPDRLSALPEEVVLRVCRHLRPRDVLSLRHTNSSLRRCVGLSLFAAAPVKLSLYNANPVLDAFPPGMLTTACLHNEGHYASPIALLSSPHVPRLLHVDLQVTPIHDVCNVGCTLRDIYAACVHMRMFLRHLRDTRSLAGPARLLFPWFFGGAGRSDPCNDEIMPLDQEPGILSHLAGLTRLVVRWVRLRQGGLERLLQLISELPSLRTLIVDPPPARCSRAQRRCPASLHAVWEQLLLNLGRPFGEIGGNFERLRLEEVEVCQKSFYCNLGVFSGMQFLKLLRLDVFSVVLEGRSTLDCPTLESMFITTTSSVVVPLGLPSLRTLHVSHNIEVVSVFGRLSDASCLKSLVLAAECGVNRLSQLELWDAVDLRSLRHVELHRDWLHPEKTLCPLSHVRRIAVTRWDVHEPSSITELLAGLEATEHLSIHCSASSPPPSINHFAVVPRLTRLSLTDLGQTPEPEGSCEVKVIPLDSPCSPSLIREVSHACRQPGSPASFPCQLFMQLEGLELSLPWVHSRLQLTQPMPRMSELHLHVQCMTDIHQSWTAMLPGLRRLTVTLRGQKFLEYHDATSSHKSTVATAALAAAVTEPAAQALTAAAAQAVAAAAAPPPQAQAPAPAATAEAAAPPPLSTTASAAPAAAPVPPGAPAAEAAGAAEAQEAAETAVAACFATSTAPGKGSSHSSGSRTSQHETTCVIGGGDGGANTNTNTNTNTSTSTSTSSSSTTNNRVFWRHVQRLTVEAPRLERFQWGWRTMFPDLLVFQLDAKLGSCPGLSRNKMGDSCLPQALFEVHLSSAEIVSQLEKEQREVDSHQHIRVLHLCGKSNTNAN